MRRDPKRNEVLFLFEKSFKENLFVESCIYFVSSVLCSSCANTHAFFSRLLLKKKDPFCRLLLASVPREKDNQGLYELCQSISPMAAPLFGCRTYLPLFRVKRQYRRWAKYLWGGGGT